MNVASRMEATESQGNSGHGTSCQDDGSGFPIQRKRYPRDQRKGSHDNLFWQVLNSSDESQ